MDLQLELIYKSFKLDIRDVYKSSKKLFIPARWLIYCNFHLTLDKSYNWIYSVHKVKNLLHHHNITKIHENHEKYTVLEFFKMMAWHFQLNWYFKYFVLPISSYTTFQNKRLYQILWKFPVITYLKMTHLINFHVAL